MKWIAFIFVLAVGAAAGAAEVMPPAPADHFTDNAHVCSPATVQALNDKLASFERDTSNQIVVAIYPSMQTDSSIEDYCVRIFNQWKVGQKGKNNGAVLFVFVKEHKMYVTTGYGLEGALPDATCKQIIDQEIAPRFKAGDYDGGLRAGVEAMLAATRGEYKGSGKTQADSTQPSGSGIHGSLFTWFIVVLLIICFVRSRFSRTTSYGRRGRTSRWSFTPTIGSWSSGSSGGSSSGGGGGGSFSGGGGSSGGGGAGGSW